jgi:hypothetical protein
LGFGVSWVGGLRFGFGIWGLGFGGWVFVGNAELVYVGIYIYMDMSGGIAGEGGEGMEVGYHVGAAKVRGGAWA